MEFQTKMFSIANGFAFTPSLSSLLKYSGYDLSKIDSPYPLERIVDSTHYGDEYGIVGYAYVLKSKTYKSTSLKLVFVITEPVVYDYQVERLLHSAFHHVCNHIHDCCGCKQERVFRTKDLGCGFWLVRTHFSYNI